MIKKTNILTGETWLYGYDNANQMTAAEHRAGNGTLLMHVDYAYDVFGNRLAKSVRTGSFGTPVVTRFAYDDQGNLWADLNVNKNLLTRYVGGDLTDQLFARISSGGAVAWYLPDHLGSVRDLTDNTGTVQDHIDYDAFGNITFESTSSFGDRYKYTGRESDVETGLQYNRARYYDPKAGRWMAKDPVGFGAGDANLYRYVGNNVTDATDPTGLDANESRLWIRQFFTQDYIDEVRAKIWFFDSLDRGSASTLSGEDLERKVDQALADEFFTAMAQMSHENMMKSNKEYHDEYLAKGEKGKNPFDGLSVAEKIGMALKGAFSDDRIKDELGDQLSELVKPKNLIIMGATIAGMVALQATPVGWIGDAAAVGLMGWEAFNVAKELVSATEMAANAQKQSEIDNASSLYAKAFVRIGIDTVISVLTWGAIKTVKAKVGKGKALEAEVELGTEAELGTGKTSGAEAEAPGKVSIPKTYERPPSFRKGVREEVWESAKGPDGKVRDPLTGREMSFDEPWDMGHKPGLEFRKHQQSAMRRGISRK